jgi:perosamine synthetase
MIPVASPVLGEREAALVADAVRSGWVSSQGAYVRAFEDAVCARCLSPYALATCNGTAALHLALAAIGIGPPDEVIVPALTFIATANAVRYVGAEPVFVDCDASTWCINQTECERALTNRTRAVIVVHLYGHPTDMDPIIAWARPRGIHVIEDAAEALGSTYRNQPVGCISDIGIFSFYGNKVITTGEGGMLLCREPHVYDRARLLRDHFMDPQRRYWHQELGYNYRMTNIQAALGVAQLERLDEFLRRKRAVAETYRRRLTRLPGVEMQAEASWARSAWWMSSIVLNPEKGWDRDHVAEELNSAGIETRPTFIPLHLLPPYARNDSHPKAERVGAYGLSLPSGAGLTNDEQERVISHLETMAANLQR